MAQGLQLALQLANCSYTYVAKHGQAITVLVARVGFLRLEAKSRSLIA